MDDREVLEFACVIKKKYERADIEVIDAENLYMNQLKDKGQITKEDDNYSSSSKISLWKFEHQVFLTKFLESQSTNKIIEKKEQVKYSLLYKLSAKEYVKILISEKENLGFIFFHTGKIIAIPINQTKIKFFKSNQLIN